jgi:hypothetical protein
MPTTLIVTISSTELQFKFLLAETPLDLRFNFVADSIIYHLLTTFMLGATIVSTLVVVIHALSD